MTIVKVDKKFRIPLSKGVKEILNIKPMDRFKVEVEGKKKVILEKVERDPLIALLENPAHVNKEKLKKINLERLEEELWTE